MAIQSLPVNAFVQLSLVCLILDADVRSIAPRSHYHRYFGILISLTNLASGNVSTLMLLTVSVFWIYCKNSDDSFKSSSSMLFPKAYRSIATAHNPMTGINLWLNIILFILSIVLMASFYITFICK